MAERVAVALPVLVNAVLDGLMDDDKVVCVADVVVFVVVGAGRVLVLRP